MGSGPKKLGDVLQNVINTMGVGDKIDAARTIEAWAALAGPEINAATRRVWLESNVLVVQLTSAIWRAELHMNRSQWRKKLNESLGSEIVKDIRFR